VWRVGISRICRFARVVQPRHKRVLSRGDIEHAQELDHEHVGALGEAVFAGVFQQLVPDVQAMHFAFGRFFGAELFAFLDEAVLGQELHFVGGGCVVGAAWLRADGDAHGAGESRQDREQPAAGGEAFEVALLFVVEVRAAHHVTCPIHCKNSAGAA
jgi:hypothetical protein